VTNLGGGSALGGRFRGWGRCVGSRADPGNRVWNLSCMNE
jgi:hypothetical protein